jgi:hypothetical protein
MLYIPRFAKEIGLDTISFQKLRVEKYSPLKEAVEATPGYYYNHIGGPVYSEKYGRKELKRIRNRIRSEFYTPGQLLHIAAKVGRIGLVDGRDVVTLAVHLPLLAYSLMCRRSHKKHVRAHRISRRSPSLQGAS